MSAVQGAPPVSPDPVCITNLHKRFGHNAVLKGVSMTARKGDVTAIIGGSGSGKSTFLRCINLLETPTSGTVTIDGDMVAMASDGRGGLKPVDRRQVQRIRTKLAMVFQSFNLWDHLTLLENVTEIPLQVLKMRKAEAVDLAEGLLRRVGLFDKRDSYPAFMSGGQKQRGAIARALAIRPQVMLFDEPTSALDPERVGEVLSLIGELAAEGRTMILVTHEMSFARNVANHVVFFANGLIEEEGPPAKIFGDPSSERLKQFIRSIH